MTVSRAPCFVRIGRAMRAGIFGAAVLCLVAPPRIARAVSAPKAQGFYMPADMSQGPAFGRGTPRPHAFRARLSPAFGLGKTEPVRLGLQVAGVYQNPKWVAGVGGSISLRVWNTAVEEIGVVAVLDHMWWQGDHPSSGAALVFDLSGLWRIGLRMDRDWLEESTIPQITFGADVPTILKKLCGKGQDDLDFED